MKRNKIFCLDDDVVDWLETVQPSKSQYIQNLIYADMKQTLDKRKVVAIDMNKSYQELEAQASEQAKKDAEKKDRQAALDSMPKILKDEVMSYNNWGEKWRVIFYPIYKKNGTITAKEFSEVV